MYKSVLGKINKLQKKLTHGIELHYNICYAQDNLTAKLPVLKNLGL
jgi:hypothetical protein